MAAKVKPIPEGFRTITPYLIITGASQAMDFYAKAFGAKERFRMAGPTEGTVGHAEMTIGDSIFMLADEFPEWGFKSPASLGGPGLSLLLYVDDVDKLFQQAINAGAKELRPVANHFYGDRMGTLVDPFGHVWSIGTHVEDVPQDELDRRAAAEMEKMKSGSS